MPAADERQVRQGCLPASGPPHQMVAVAPDRWPVAVVDDAAAIAGYQRAAGGRGNPLMGMAGLALELGVPK